MNGIIMRKQNVFIVCIAREIFIKIRSLSSWLRAEVTYRTKKKCEWASHSIAYTKLCRVRGLGKYNYGESTIFFSYLHFIASCIAGTQRAMPTFVSHQWAAEIFFIQFKQNHARGSNDTSFTFCLFFLNFNATALANISYSGRRLLVFNHVEHSTSDYYKYFRLASDHRACPYWI